MSQKLLFIFNPHAGKGQIKNHLVDIVDMMVKAGFDVTIYTTQAQADATRKVVEEGAGYDRIVCSGGDGTLDAGEAAYSDWIYSCRKYKRLCQFSWNSEGDAKGSGTCGWTKQISM